MANHTTQEFCFFVLVFFLFDFICSVCRKCSVNMCIVACAVHVECNWAIKLVPNEIAKIGWWFSVLILCPLPSYEQP